MLARCSFLRFGAWRHISLSFLFFLFFCGLFVFLLISYLLLPACRIVICERLPQKVHQRFTFFF